MRYLIGCSHVNRPYTAAVYLMLCSPQVLSTTWHRLSDAVHLFCAQARMSLLAVSLSDACNSVLLSLPAPCSKHSLLSLAPLVSATVALGTTWYVSTTLRSGSAPGDNSSSGVLPISARNFPWACK